MTTAVTLRASVVAVVVVLSSAFFASPREPNTVIASDRRERGDLLHFGTCSWIGITTSACGLLVMTHS
ncbi:MAG TPA: hypothetical protein PKY31_07285 [Spirochaetota bacterium]|nr:hypothetical protein [Spirochaetota bacterium]